MSQYSRAEFNANAGLVVGIAPDGLPRRRARRRRVPAPLGTRRLRGRRRRLPGARRSASKTSSPAARPPRSARWRRSISPASARPTSRAACRTTPIAAIREALPAFARQIPGFAMADAVMTGVETRTSSPIRIPRDGGFQSVNTAGLYPGRRRRGLCRRHPLRRRRRHPRGGSRGHGPHRPGSACGMVTPPQRSGTGLRLI